MVLFQALWFAYLAVVLLASSIWKEQLWGANFWSFLSQTATFLIFMIVIAAYSWKRFGGETLPTGQEEKSHTGNSGRSKTDPSRKRPKEKPVFTRNSLFLILISAIVLATMRSNHRLWGEAAAYPEAFTSMSASALSSPVSWAVNWCVYSFLNSVLVLEPSEASAVVSIISGIAFVIASILMSRKLEGISGVGSFAVSPVFILLNGYIAVFLTIGKSPLATLFVLLFLYSSITFIERRGSILKVTLFYLLSLFSQPAALFTTVPFIYLLFLAAGEEKLEKRRKAVDSAALALTIVAAALLTSTLMKAARPVRVISIIAVESLKRFISGGLVDQRIWMDTLNELLILGPASVAALILIFKGPGWAGRPGTDGVKRRLDRFMMLSVLSALIMLPISSWRIDGGLNWHVVASTGPVFAVFSLWMLSRNFHRRYRRMVYLLALIGAFQTIPWLIVNSSEGTAGKRLLSLPVAPGKAETILGGELLDRGNPDKALEMLTAAKEKDRKNHKARYLLGKIYIEKERYADAIANLTEAVEIDSTNVEYNFLLADAFIKKRWFDDAITKLRPLVDRYPDSARFWQRLGYAYNHSGKYEDAVAAYRKALELEPERSSYKQNLTSALINRGAELQGAKEMNRARSCYLEAIDLIPTAWAAYNNLIAIEIEEGNLETAEEMLKEVLKINPYGPELNLNMANLLEKKGDIKRAIEYFERASSLNPMISGVERHIDSLKSVLKEKGKKGG